MSEAFTMSNLFNIHRSRDNFHIVKRELAALGHNIAIDYNHCASIIVQSIAIAALLVCIQINTTTLQHVSMILEIG